MANQTRWQKLRALSWADRCLLLRAVIWLPVMGLALRCFGVRRCQALFGRRSTSKNVPATDENVEVARGMARLVRIAATHGFYSANCLERSLLLWSWLR